MGAKGDKRVREDPCSPLGNWGNVSGNIPGNVSLQVNKLKELHIEHCFHEVAELNSFYFWMTHTQYSYTLHEDAGRSLWKKSRGIFKIQIRIWLLWSLIVIYFETGVDGSWIVTDLYSRTARTQQMEQRRGMRRNKPRMTMRTWAYYEERKSNEVFFHFCIEELEQELIRICIKLK